MRPPANVRCMLTALACLLLSIPRLAAAEVLFAQAGSEGGSIGGSIEPAPSTAATGSGGTCARTCTFSATGRRTDGGSGCACLATGGGACATARGRPAAGPGGGRSAIPSTGRATLAARCRLRAATPCASPENRTASTAIAVHATTAGAQRPTGTVSTRGAARGSARGTSQRVFIGRARQSQSYEAPLKQLRLLCNEEASWRRSVRS